jgi:tRNA(Arg) A34 adenosine deaminase TadA
MGRAFLVHDGVAYFGISRKPWQTPVTSLIQGIWYSHPESALRMLRERIFTDFDLDPRSVGMIKVAAKRHGILSPEDFHARLGQIQNRREIHAPEPEEFQIPDIPIQGRHGTSPIQDALDSMKTRISGGLPVSAILLGPDGRILSGAISTSHRNKTAHAELNLVQSWWNKTGGAFPEGSCIHVSLRPCAMCAAQILSASPRSGPIEVIFHKEDPGPASKNSCLFEGSDLWKKAGSPQVRIRRA